MTSAEVAAYLSTSTRSLRAACARGFIPRGMKLPGLGLRWRRSVLDQWIEDTQTEGSA